MQSMNFISTGVLRLAEGGVQSITLQATEQGRGGRGTLMTLIQCFGKGVRRVADRKRNRTGHHRDSEVRRTHKRCCHQHRTSMCFRKSKLMHKHARKHTHTEVEDSGENMGCVRIQAFASTRGGRVWRGYVFFRLPPNGRETTKSIPPQTAQKRLAFLPKEDKTDFRSHPNQNPTRSSIVVEPQNHNLPSGKKNRGPRHSPLLSPLPLPRVVPLPPPTRGWGDTTDTHIQRVE